MRKIWQTVEGEVDLAKAEMLARFKVQLTWPNTIKLRRNGKGLTET